MKLIVALLLAFILVWVLVNVARGDDRRFLQCADNSGYEVGPCGALSAQRALTQTATWPWQYIQEGPADILAPVAEALDEFSAAFSIYVYPSSNSQRHIASGGNAFIYGSATHPGCGFGATACLAEYGRNVDIVYDAVSMFVWGFRSQVAVGLHENGHAMMDAGEMYRHTGDSIACTSKPWTIMDCGIGHALFIQSFDRETFALFHYPKPLRKWGQGWHPDGTPYVFACEVDSRATRVAVLDENGWTGVYIAPQRFCNGSGGGAVVPRGHCYFLKAENELSWRYSLTEVFAGCVP